MLGLEEFRTEAELDQLLFDMNTMRLQVRVVMMMMIMMMIMMIMMMMMVFQALVITERVLGCLHKDTIFR